MVWKFYRFEDAPCIDDFCDGLSIGTVFYELTPEREKELVDLQGDIVNAVLMQGGVMSFPAKELDRMRRELIKYPFTGREPIFGMYKPIVDANSYKLTLSSKVGLIRQVITTIPQESITLVIPKSAGRGSGEDFELFAKFFLERLPKIEEEVVKDDRERAGHLLKGLFCMQSPDYLSDTRAVDWRRHQKRIQKDFYNNFRKSVEYSAVEVCDPFRLNAIKAKELIRLVEPLNV